MGVRDKIRPGVKEDPAPKRLGVKNLVMLSEITRGRLMQLAVSWD